MAITFHGVARNIADNGTEDDSVARAITPPASMVTGDLVIITALVRNSVETPSIADTGGQTWTSNTNHSGIVPDMRRLWCRFNGTWSANPTLQTVNATGSAFTLEMCVFRPTSGSNTWAVDVAEVRSHTASPPSPYDSTITGRTAIATSTVTLASLGAGDDKACTLQTAGWTNPGGATQIRNLSGNDTTLVSAYKILTAPGATGNVVVRQTTTGVTTVWLIETWKEIAAAGPAITDVDTDEIVTGVQANVVITGTSFGASQGDGSVKLIDGTQVSTLNVDSWADTSIQVDMALGGCRYGQRTLRVTTDDLATADITITVNPPSGSNVTDLTTLRALSFNERNCPSRLYSVPDIPDNAQVTYSRSAGSGTVVLDEDGRLAWDDTATQMVWAWNNGNGWSPTYTWELRGLAPEFIGPVANDLILQNGAAMTPIGYASKFEDEDSPTGTYSYTPAITGVSIDSSTGILSGTPTVDGTVAIVVRRTDEGGLYAETNSHSALISPAPTRPSFSGSYLNAVATIGVAITPIDAAAGWTGATTFVQVGAPPGVSIDLSNGQITGIPLALGVFSITVIASNAVGASPEHPSFSMTVEAAEVEEAVIPNLVGLLLADAEATLIAAQFTLGTQTSEENALGVGFIFGQDPVAGTLAPLGTIVNVKISLGLEVEPPEPPFVPPAAVPKNRRPIPLRTFLLG